MGNNFNFSKKDINKILNNAQGKTNININELKKAADSGNLDNFVDKNLSSNDSEKLKKILSDKSAVENLLKSDAAKDLMKRLMEGK